MNKGRLLEYISNPFGLTEESVTDLLELRKQYPYYQGAYILLASALNLSNDVRFSEMLKEAAVHCPDRSWLYEVIHAGTEKSTSVQDVQFVKEAQKSEPIEEKAQLLTQSTDLPIPVSSKANEDIQSIPEQKIPVVVEQNIIEEILSYPEINTIADDTSSQIAAESNYTFFEWLELLPNLNEEQQTINEAPAEIASPHKSRTELIDQFILANPKISQPAKAEFFSPVIMAKRSIEDRNEIVSETLAQIYENQGNIAKAIHIYKKLSLQDPTKSSYFAALIQKLENQT